MFGEPSLGIPAIIRSVLPGRPYMVLAVTLLLNILSCVLVAIVFKIPKPLTTVTEAAGVVVSVCIGLVQYNLTTVMSQGAGMATQMLMLWTAITDVLLNIHTFAGAFATKSSTRERTPVLLTELLLHATRIVYSKKRLILHSSANDLNNDEDDRAADRTLYEAKAELLQVLVKNDTLDLQTVTIYADLFSTQVSALQTLRMAYVPIEYNIASMSFFTLTYGIFFPLSAYTLFGWWYLVINTIFLLHMLSNYDTAVTLGDAFHSQAGSIGHMARGITDGCVGTIQGPLPVRQ